MLQRLTIHYNLSAVRPQYPADQMEKGALTGTAWPGNRYMLALLNLPLRNIQNRYRSSVYTELLVQCMNLEQSKSLLSQYNSFGQ
ncbi:hypothetical protein D3C85_1676650 [compost metagenome]